MPYLKLQTNQELSSTQKQKVLLKLSKEIAAELGKPEAYFMTAFEFVPEMTLGGSFDPLAFVQLKSIGLSEALAKKLSSAICDVIKSELSILGSRVYIEFKDAPGKLWGYNSSTF